MPDCRDHGRGLTPTCRSSASSMRPGPRRGRCSASGSIPIRRACRSHSTGCTVRPRRSVKAIIDATADLACAFKPQIAYFASQGEEQALERICRYVRETYPDVTLILDAKRGDIGSTAKHYAEEAFGRYGAHAVTVNPYLGTDSIEPYFEHGGGIIALCRTSNPGGDDIQSLVADGSPIYAHVARLVADDWSKRGDCGSSSAPPIRPNWPTSERSRPNVPILVPGVGAQGGDAATVVEHGAATGRSRPDRQLVAGDPLRQWWLRLRRSRPRRSRTHRSLPPPPHLSPRPTPKFGANVALGATVAPNLCSVFPFDGLRYPLTRCDRRCTAPDGRQPARCDLEVAAARRTRLERLEDLAGTHQRDLP